MKRISTRLGLGAALIAGVGVAGFALLNSFNQFDKVAAGFDGACTPVAGIAGPEDIEIDDGARRAFISSFDRRAAKEAPRGGVFAFSVDDPLSDSAWRDRTGGVPGAFEPLGLNLYSDAQTERLFVVNAATNSVELYEVAGNGDLTHIETFSERRRTSPNDVVAVGPRSFYVTNDVESGRDSLLGRLHFLFRVGSGRVLYFDGISWRVAADGLKFANGVNISADKSRLYVAETAAAAIRIYDRDPDTGALTPIRTAPMGAAVDNINVDASGSLWIGAHQKPLLLSAYARNPDAKAPSLVLRYDDVDGVNARPTEVYADDGSEISASTAAARLGSILMIGALAEKKFLICELPG
jgi:arylesterase/paraoxonase